MTSARPAVQESLYLGHRFERSLYLPLPGASWWSCSFSPAGTPSNGSSGKATESSTTWFGTNRSIAGAYESWGADLLRETITSFQRHFFQNAAQIRLWTALRVRDVCSTRRVCYGVLSGSGRTGGKLPDRVPPEFPSTLSAHCLHSCRRTTSRNSQSDDLGWLMPDQHTAVRIPGGARSSSSVY
jgi:hypothetical protein